MSIIRWYTEVNSVKAVKISSWDQEAVVPAQISGEKRSCT